MIFIIQTDGASRGNPGKASYGFVIKDQDGSILHQEGQKIGITTNNVAEYTAVLKALEYIKKNFKNNPHRIEVVADSLLIVSQLMGQYKIKSIPLRVIFDAIKSLEMELGSVTYRQVPRAQNFLADRMANLALDNK